MDNNEKLRSYIEKCARDACASENREYDVEMQWRIIGNDLIFAVKSKYKKVRNRIEFRLLNNLKKNFGYNFHLVRPESQTGDFFKCYEDSMYYILESKGYLIGDRTFIPIDKIFVNGFVDKWELFGKECILCTYYRNNLGTDDDMMEAMLEHGYHIGGTIDEFLDAYKKIYGMTPLEYLGKNIKTLKRLYRIKNLYERDEFDHDCGYWSVCSTRGHECPCSPSSKVKQGFSIDVWDSLSKHGNEY